MKAEKRVYVVDDLENLNDKSPTQLTNEEFINYAEQTGKVYTLDSFVEAFNNEEINSSCDFIRIIDIEASDLHISTINVVELASELAEQKSQPEFDDLDEIFNGENYTEEAQEIFDKWYDYYTDLIERTKV